MPEAKGFGKIGTSFGLLPATHPAFLTFPSFLHNLKRQVRLDFAIENGAPWPNEKSPSGMSDGLFALAE